MHFMLDGGEYQGYFEFAIELRICEIYQAPAAHSAKFLLFLLSSHFARYDIA